VDAATPPSTSSRAADHSASLADGSGNSLIPDSAAERASAPAAEGAPADISAASNDVPATLEPASHAISATEAQLQDSMIPGEPADAATAEHGSVKLDADSADRTASEPVTPIQAPRDAPEHQGLPHQLAMLTQTQQQQQQQQMQTQMQSTSLPPQPPMPQHRDQRLAHQALTPNRLSPKLLQHLTPRPLRPVPALLTRRCRSMQRVQRGAEKVHQTSRRLQPPGPLQASKALKTGF
jgi:hypothetical protein